MRADLTSVRPPACPSTSIEAAGASTRRMQITLRDIWLENRGKALDGVAELKAISN
jgi:hypothetical protein